MGEERLGDRTTPTGRKLTVSEAADELGISAEAVCSRVKRGTLRSKKVGTTVYVLFDADQTETGRDQSYARTPPEHDQAADQTHVRPDPREELVESLLDQVTYMREQLAEEREARRRADTIIAQLTQANAVLAGRGPEIEPPSTRDAPETTSEDVSGTDTHR